MDKEAIKSFALRIENYSKTLSSKEQEIISLIVLSIMDPLTRTNWLLSNKKENIFFQEELNLLEKLAENHS